MVSPILVALDLSSLSQAEALARSLANEVAGFKVGLELLMAEGPEAVTRIAELGKPVLVDAKLHDIPNTVERAAGRLGERGARWVTVHASGGSEMVAAAVAGLGKDSRGQPGGVIAVTVLTSLDQADRDNLGFPGSVHEQVARLTQIARRGGAEGVVCSPNEVAAVRSVSQDLLVITPGIRPAGIEGHDQRRVATPETAMRAGADLIVMGRAITEAADPLSAAVATNRKLGVE